MWLKKLVGIVLTVSLVAMNFVVVKGLTAPDKPSQAAAIVKIEPSVVAAVPAPTVKIEAATTSIPAKTTGSLSWTTTGNPSDCEASGSWTGTKTAFGAESTGRINTPGNYVYTLTCSNTGGKAEASVTLSVGNAVPPKNVTTSTSTPKPGATGGAYCQGRSPCYGKNEIASHGSSGNCWGYNIDLVFNISGFDAGYHEVKSGISSIQVSSVCGKDLASSLNGSASAEGQTRNHNQTTKTNADKSVSPYFVGYFDANK